MNNDIAGTKEKDGMPAANTNVLILVNTNYSLMYNKLHSLTSVIWTFYLWDYQFVNDWWASEYDNPLYSK